LPGQLGGVAGQDVGREAEGGLEEGKGTIAPLHSRP
jgi:hypothetical protein